MQEVENEQTTKQSTNESSECEAKRIDERAKRVNEEKDELKRKKAAKRMMAKNAIEEHQSRIYERELAL